MKKCALPNERALIDPYCIETHNHREWMLHLANVIQLPRLPIIRYSQVIQIHLLNLLGMVGFHVPGPLLDSYMVKIEQELTDFYDFQCI